MQINGTHQIHGTQALNGPHFNNRPQQATSAASSQPVDQLDLSPAALAASESSGSDGIRTDLVAQLRQQIASGTYDTADKLESAVDRLFDSLG
ncbi:flagellar biosynthesis anti-sigma factor FlgM [Aeoliella sp. ICT_H6.2]|uniref:Flagellar biosynthesis anti-sigma factor FlgM n=1 Tax=Aeoliella straminimaris TaxID=2954799 RepID=A0A9X2FGM8_9BACT|nr:flagellar biosynthesis anti-sigma factor FlgM [Aeoliella straminimaris]MCO6047812.1 flagellar biosynthesis anti-sigma factor FlgM [Aeoliella straminimaris]